MSSKVSLLNTHIKGAKNGEQTSFSYLLDTFWNDIYLFQFSRTKNEFEAEEIAIKTFSNAFDKIASYNEEYSFKNWLLAISKNAHIDEVRKQKNKFKKATQYQEDQMKSVLDDAPTPEDLMITKQNLAALLEHIKQLKPEYQKIIQLRFFQQMSYKELAVALDEPMNNIKVKLLRAKKLLLLSLNIKKQ